MMVVLAMSHRHTPVRNYVIYETNPQGVGPLRAFMWYILDILEFSLCNVSTTASGPNFVSRTS